MMGRPAPTVACKHFCDQHVQQTLLLGSLQSSLATDVQGEKGQPFESL